MNTVFIACIAACYLPTLAIEIVRRQSVLEPLDGETSVHRITFSFLATVFLTLIGICIQTWYLIGKIDIVDDLTPLSSLQGGFLSASWLLSIIFLASLRRSYGSIFSILIMTASLCLITLALCWGSDQTFPRQPVMHSWGIIHGLSQLTFFVSLTIGLIVGILYLWQDRRLKQRLSLVTWKLPSLERLARANRSSLIWALVALAPGIVSGVVLLNARHGTISFADFAFNPAILGSLIIFIWILLTIIRSTLMGALTEARATARRTIFLFVLLAISLVAAYFTPNGHLRSEWSSSQSSPEIQKTESLPVQEDAL